MKGRQGSRAKILAEQMAKCDKGEAETKEDKAEVKDACEGWRVHVGRMHIGGRSWGKKEKETRNGTEQEGERGGRAARIGCRGDGGGRVGERTARKDQQVGQRTERSNAQQEKREWGREQTEREREKERTHK